MKAAYTRQSVARAYQAHGNIKAVCAETGCPPYVAFVWLKKSGALKVDDKSIYGSNSCRMGGLAEREFQRLVPNAMNANEHIRQGCPSFDFDISGTTVDVKYSSIRDSTGGWLFKTAIHKRLRPDYYVSFFATHKSGLLSDGYRCFVFPHELIADRNQVFLRPDDKQSHWLDFEIAPGDLAAFFKESIACLN